MSTNLNADECVALASEWMMLDRRTEKWSFLCRAFVAWNNDRDWMTSDTKKLTRFLTRRKDRSNLWVKEFNSFNLFALTHRLTGKI